MKTRTKLLTLFLTVMLFVGVVTASVMAVNAESTATLDIAFCNLSFKDRVFIKFAVDTDKPNDTKLLVWKSAQTDYTYGSEDAVLENVGYQTIEGKDYYIYDYTDLTAKNMADNVYVRAYLNDGTTVKYGEVCKYSALQYAYNKLGKTGVATTDEELKTLLTDMLKYGASAQKYFNHNEERLADSDFYEVKLNAGLLSDMTASGLYLAGEEVTIIAPLTDENAEDFAHWENSLGVAISESAVATITVGTKNEVYTPVYGVVAPSYSEGLEFESNGDGTCILLGMGTCTDSEVIIPPTSSNGDTVVEIDSSAFADEEITSITIPATVTYIGRNAFKNCTSLADVYFNGSQAEWENVDIHGTGNTSLTNATLHFTVTVTYTVIFKDYDGTELKRETVESGKGATAPADPARANFTFTGWDKAFNNITADTTVTATYTFTSSEATLFVDNVRANAGETVTVPVLIANNPGIAGIKFTIGFDSALTLTASSLGNALSVLDHTPPGEYSNPCNFLWDSISGEATADGIAVNLTFEVPANAVSGDIFNITCSYKNGAIYDENTNDVTLATLNGSITVK